MSTDKLRRNEVRLGLALLAGLTGVLVAAIVVRIQQAESTGRHNWMARQDRSDEENLFAAETGAAAGGQQAIGDELRRAKELSSNLRASPLDAGTTARMTAADDQVPPDVRVTSAADPAQRATTAAVSADTDSSAAAHRALEQEETVTQPYRDPPAPRYVVRTGDTLWSIARRLYGHGEFYAALVAHNRHRLADAALIHVGDELETPPVHFLQSHYPKLCPR